MTKKTQKPPEVCPKCGGDGCVITEAGAVPCDCRRAPDALIGYRRARVPRKFMQKSLQSFSAKNARQRDIVAGARSFLQTFRGSADDHPTKGLLLIGREGTGKTHIAVAILKEAIMKGFTGLYWNVPELFLELRRLMSDDSGITEADLFDEAARADLLVLDDLGAERSSEYVMDRLYVLINGRYQNDSATIITTNRTPEELRTQIGPRIASRICEMCVPIDFPEGDYRLQNLK
jgi:DNA replication protein DnaC